MAEQAGATRKTKIFISYSRKNKAFVRKLNDAIDAAGIDAWVDWEGIPLSSDWMAEITAAIEAGDAFVFVITPDSLKSKVCIDELELGIKHNKRIIPVLYLEPEKGQKMHPKLASTNWVYMRPKKDDFSDTVPKLVEAIQTDLGWVQQHTRLLQRASEWVQKKNNKSFLLQGTDLDDGEHWMTEATATADRQITPLQAEYISNSRKIAVQRQRNLTIGVGAALVLSIFMGIYAFSQRAVAMENEQKAVSNGATAVANEHARATQQVIAEENKKIADENARKAKAQRSAATAKIYQDKAGELDISTLLAVDAYQQLPDLLEAENILRQNITLLAPPIAQMNVGARIWKTQVSPDGEEFVTSDEGGQACIWNMEDGAQILCTKQEGIVYDAVFSMDGNTLITGTDAGMVTFWDVASGKQKGSLKFDGTIWDLSIHRKGRWVGVARTNAVSLINIETMKEESFFTQTSDVYKIDFDSSGRYMAIGLSNGNVFMWDIPNNRIVPELRHNNAVYDVAFSPDAVWLVGAGADSAVRVTKLGEGTQKYSVVHGDWLEDIAFGPDSSWYVTASDDNLVRVIDTATGQERMRMNHTGYVTKVRVSSDGQWIASTGYDGTARIWDAATGNEVMQIPIGGKGTAIDFNADTTRLVVTDQEGHITLWDVSQLRARKGFIQFTEFLHEAYFAPNGEWLITNADDKNIWMIPSDQLGNKDDGRKKLTTTSGLTYGLAVSNDSKWIAAVGYDSNISEYNRVTLVSVDGTKKYLLSHNNEVINAVTFTPDNKQAITADQTGQVYVWDVETGEKNYELKMDGDIASLAVSPDGQYLVAGVNDEIKPSLVWSLKEQKQIAVLDQFGFISIVRFNNDGTLLATGSSESTVYLWKVEKGVFTLANNGDIPTNGEVATIEFDPANNKIIAVGDSAGYVYLWDIDLGQEVARLRHNNKVSNVAFSLNGKQLVTVANKTLLLWDIPSIPFVPRDQLIDTACSRLTHNLSKIKWEILFFEDEYRIICPNLPAGEN